MTDEWLAVVNERDEVVDRRLRSDIHRLQLRHRSVHLLVFNPNNEIFLQRRALSKDINPGLWDTSAAGHVDFGEEILTSALRELREELGITPRSTPEFLIKLEADANTGWEFISLFKTVAEEPLVLEASEILEGKWLSELALNHWIDTGGHGLTATFLRIWSTYRLLKS